AWDGGGTPEVVETVADGASLQPRDSITRAGTPWLLGFAVVVSLAALVFFVIWLRDPPVHPGATPTSPDSVQDGIREVTIHVVGAPHGATALDAAESSEQNPSGVVSP